MLKAEHCQLGEPLVLWTMPRTRHIYPFPIAAKLATLCLVAGCIGPDADRQPVTTARVDKVELLPGPTEVPPGWFQVRTREGAVAIALSQHHYAAGDIVDVRYQDAAKIRVVVFDNGAKPSLNAPCRIEKRLVSRVWIVYFVQPSSQSGGGWLLIDAETSQRVRGDYAWIHDIGWEDPPPQPVLLPDGPPMTLPAPPGFAP